MPKIPEYQSVGGAARSTVLPQSGNANLNIDVPLGAFGAPPSLDAYDRSQRDAYELRQKGLSFVYDFANDVALTKAKAEATDAYNKYLHGNNAGADNPGEEGDDGTGALHRRGQNAIDFSGSKDAFKKRLDEIGAWLPPRAHAGFKELRSNLELDFSSKLNQHAYNESRQLEKETFEYGVKSALNDAGLNYKDSYKVEEALQTTEELVRKSAASDGDTPEVEAYRVKEAKARIHRSVIEHMILNNEEETAAGYFAATRSQLMDADVIHVEKAIQNANEIKRAQKVSMTLTAKYPSLAKALPEIDKITNGKVKERVIDMMRERYAILEAGKKQSSEAVFEGFVRDIKNGKSFEDIQKDPRYLAMPGDMSKSLQAFNDDFLGGPDRKTDPAAWAEFYNLTMDEFRRMSAVDIQTRYLSKFSNADQRDAKKELADRRKLLENPATVEVMSPAQEIKAFLDVRLNKREGEKLSKEENKVLYYLSQKYSAAINQYQSGVLGGKKATPEQRKIILDDVILKDVVKKPGYFSDTETPAALVPESKRESYIVDFEKIPKSFVDNANAEYRRRGISPSTREKEKLKRAYAEWFMTKDQNRVRKILFGDEK